MMKFDLYESRLFGRICYGFGRDEKGYVYIKDDEASISSMALIYASPSSVKVRGDEERSKSCVCNSSSSFLTVALSAGWETKRFLAAFVKLFSL